MSVSPYLVVDRPVVTERASVLSSSETPQYVFKVKNWANKIQVAQAIETIYNVKVASVNTIVQKGKKKRQGRFEGQKSDWKKAFVTLRAGFKIELF